jgi:hypothetical protein
MSMQDPERAERSSLRTKLNVAAEFKNLCDPPSPRTRRRLRSPAPPLHNPHLSL